MKLAKFTIHVTCMYMIFIRSNFVQYIIKTITINELKCTCTCFSLRQNITSPTDSAIIHNVLNATLQCNYTCNTCACHMYCKCTYFVNIQPNHLHYRTKYNWVMQHIILLALPPLLRISLQWFPNYNGYVTLLCSNM